MIIYNLLFMLLTNTLLPSLPLPPHAYILLPVAGTIAWKQPSAYEFLRLNRIHNETELKGAFREAMRQYHPDQGGNPEIFNYIRNIKTILSRPEPALYDALGMTEFPASDKPEEIKQLIENRKFIYWADCAMFYLVAFVFMMGLTIHPDSRHVRKYLLIAFVSMLGQEVYAFLHPEQPTLLDLVFPRMPLFQQFVVLRDFFSVFLVIIRIVDSRRTTEEKSLLRDIQKEPEDLGSVVAKLTRLNEIYHQKIEAKETDQKSLVSRIKQYIWKGLTLLFVCITAYSMISKR